jgi:hypothetical protein
MQARARAREAGEVSMSKRFIGLDPGQEMRKRATKSGCVTLLETVMQMANVNTEAQKQKQKRTRTPCVFSFLD